MTKAAGRAQSRSFFVCGTRERGQRSREETDEDNVFALPHLTGLQTAAFWQPLRLRCRRRSAARCVSGKQSTQRVVAGRRTKGAGAVIKFRVRKQNGIFRATYRLFGRLRSLAAFDIDTLIALCESTAGYEGRSAKFARTTAWRQYAEQAV